MFADEAHAAGALIDDGGHCRFSKVRFSAGGAAGVDEAHAAHVAVGDLVAAHVDGVVGGKFCVHFVAELPEIYGLEAAVVCGKLLLYDVGLHGNAEAVRLARHVCGRVVFNAVLFERSVAQVAPKYCGHAEFVGVFESLGDFHKLPAAFLRAEIACRSDRHGAHVPRLLDGAEHHLVIGIGIGEELVVVYLYDEGDFMRIFARDGA